MKKKFLSYFLSFLMVLSVFTQSSTSLYAQENTEKPMQSEVQEETIASEENEGNDDSQESLQ